jgi:hypothetical protein
MDRRGKLWELLFKTVLDRDANKPENEIRARILGERQAKEMRRLKGGVLFEELESQIRKGVLTALQTPATSNCGCPTCNMIRSINTLIELWIDLERIAEKGEDDGYREGP